MSVDRADPGRGDPAGMLAASRERASKATTVRAAQNEMLRAAAEADPSVWSGQARESFVAAAAAAAMELGWRRGGTRSRPPCLCTAAASKR